MLAADDISVPVPVISAEHRRYHAASCSGCTYKLTQVRFRNNIVKKAQVSVSFIYCGNFDFKRFPAQLSAAELELSVFGQQSVYCRRDLGLFRGSL